MRRIKEILQDDTIITVGDIAKKYNISRQYVHEFIKKYMPNKFIKLYYGRRSILIKYNVLNRLVEEAIKLVGFYVHAAPGDKVRLYTSRVVKAYCYGRPSKYAEYLAVLISMAFPLVERRYQRSTVMFVFHKGDVPQFREPGGRLLKKFLCWGA